MKNKKQSEYDEFLSSTHAKLVTSDEVIQDVIREGTGQHVRTKSRIIAGEVSEVYDVTFENNTHDMYMLKNYLPILKFLHKLIYLSVRKNEVVVTFINCLQLLYNQLVNSSVFLSVVIPCYDEMANLQKGVLQKVQNFLDKKKISYEVIISDDGSKDGSTEFISDFVKENKAFRLLQNSHAGKAGAVTAGILVATGEYILFTDMDQATPIEEVDKLLPYFDEDFDIVIGSRNNKRKGAPLTRLFISRANILLRKMIVGVRDISDTQCGFKMFRKNVAKTLFTKVKDIHHGFKNISGSNVSSGFDVELLYLAEKMGYKIKEAPVNWLYVETRRVNPVKDSVEGLLDLFKIKQNAIAGLYDTV